MQENTHVKVTTSHRHFKQINFQQRQLIERWYAQKVPIVDIAQRLGMHRSSIYRELRRGRVKHLDSELREFYTYSADFSEERHEENMTAKGTQIKIGFNHDLVKQFNSLIFNHHMSLYAARQVLIGRGIHVPVCTRTLYNYVHAFGFPLTPRQLFHPSRKKQKIRIRKRLAMNTIEATSIDKRPQFINDRSEIGHHEMDTVVGPPGSKHVLLVLTERVTRFEHILILKDKSARSVCKALDRLERYYGSRFNELFKSITCDNGCEFSDAVGIVKSCRRKSPRTRLFYAHPYCASERGSNENANRLIRRFLPKGTNLASLRQCDLDHLAMWMNRYPRKILNGASAFQLFKAYSFHCRKSAA